MADRIPPDLSAAVTILRALRGWKRRTLADALGIEEGSVYQYEIGRREPKVKTLQRMVAVMGFPADLLFRVLSLVETSRAAIEPRRAADPEAAERAEVDELVAGMVRRGEEFWRGEGARFRAKSRAIEERREARWRWQRLRDLGPAERLALVQEGRELQSWAMSELLCLESERAAADSAKEAVALAELAVEVARRVAWEEPARQGLEGWAWAFVANARRVSGKPAWADEAFAECSRLWKAGSGAELEVLDGTRLLDLEASLRRNQGRLPEALALLERALRRVPDGPRSGRLLVIKAKTLEALGQHEEAIATLGAAEALIDAERDPRLDWVRRQNLAKNIYLAGRAAEAELLLPALRGLAERLGNQLDLLRQDWLEGQVAARRGRTAEAEATFARVRGAFTELKIPYDAVLATLDLAEVYAAQGRSREVRVLVRRSLPIFRAERVHKEAQRALELFRRAAEAEAVSVVLVRSLVSYLLRARHDERLRFEPAGDLAPA